jgi:hypothetical protein
MRASVVEDHISLWATELTRYPSGFVLAITIVLLITCSASEAAEQQAKLARSSIATVVLVLGAQLKGTVPSAYVQRTLDAMVAVLSDAARRQPDANTPVDGSETASPAKQALDAIDRAQAAMKIDDSLSIARTRNALMSIADKLASPKAQRRP